MAHGVRVGRKRVERLDARGQDLRDGAPQTRPHHDQRPRRPRRRRPRRAPVPAGRAEPLWVADVTYLQTWEGWLYLAAVQDAYSRAIVGWSMADHMRAELVVDALQMAVAPPPPGARTDPPQRPGIAIRLPGLRPGRTRRRHRALDGLQGRLPTTTPSPRASSPRSRRSSSTAALGRPAASSPARSSSTSKPSTTASAATPRSGCSRHWSSRTALSA